MNEIKLIEKKLNIKAGIVAAALGVHRNTYYKWKVSQTAKPQVNKAAWMIDYFHHNGGLDEWIKELEKPFDTTPAAIQQAFLSLEETGFLLHDLLSDGISVQHQTMNKWLTGQATPSALSVTLLRALLYVPKDQFEEYILYICPKRSNIS